MAVDITQRILLVVVEHIFALILIGALLWQIHFCFNQIRRRLSPSFSDHISHPPSPAHGTPPDPSLLKHLPSFTYSSTAEAEGQSQSPPECVICLIEFKEGDMGPVLPNCDHLFHLDCIDKWLRRNKTCPLCRKVVYPPSTVNLPPPIRCPIGVAIEIPEEVHRWRPVEITSGS